MTKVMRVLASIVLAVAVTQAQERTAANPNDATQKLLIANEHALYEAFAKADKASFQSLVLPEGVWTTTSGFVPMRLLVDGLEGFQLTKWGIENPHVTVMDGNSAIVLYVRMSTGTFNDQPLAPTTLASTVWTKRNGKWLAVHHQETDLIQ